PTIRWRSAEPALGRRGVACSPLERAEGDDVTLTLANVEVVYSDVVVGLRGVSLTVPPGAIVALLGANGAGKTTCLRAISGLLDVHRGKITKGSITFEGERIDRSDATNIVRRGVAQVLEGRRIFPELTVDENLRAGTLPRLARLHPRGGEGRHGPAGRRARARRRRARVLLRLHRGATPLLSRREALPAQEALAELAMPPLLQVQSLTLSFSGLIAL